MRGASGCAQRAAALRGLPRFWSPERCDSIQDITSFRIQMGRFAPGSCTLGGVGNLAALRFQRVLTDHPQARATDNGDTTSNSSLILISAVHSLLLGIQPIRKAESPDLQVKPMAADRGASLVAPISDVRCTPCRVCPLPGIGWRQTLVPLRYNSTELARTLSRLKHLPQRLPDWTDISRQLLLGADRSNQRSVSQNS